MGRLPVGPLLFVLAQLLLLRGFQAPAYNEEVYLNVARGFWSPEAMAGDWTLGGSWGPQTLFSWLFGWLVGLIGLGPTAWLGRLLCWTAMTLGLFRLGRSLGLGEWWTAAVTLTWVACGQSIVGGSWTIGGFESKALAYPLLVFSLALFIEKRPTTAALLLGASFSFHAGVGLWAAPAAAFGLVLTGEPFSRLLRVTGWTFLASLPGLIPSLIEMQESHGTEASWWFYILCRVPRNVDPASWPLRDLFAVCVLFGFGLLHAMSRRNDRATRFLVGFELAGFAFFATGLIARALEIEGFLRLFPFRLFSVFVIPLFLFRIARALKDRRLGAERPWLLVAALVAAIHLPSPFIGYRDRLANHHRQRTAPIDATAESFLWIEKNTPRGSVVLAPPWRRDAIHRMRRPQIALWFAPRRDAIDGWTDRILDIVGSDYPDPLPRDVFSWLEESYGELTTDEVRGLAEKYDVRYFVTDRAHPFPVEFSRDGLYVYSVER